MWSSIARKEFTEALRTPRFLVATLLCLMLVPASLYVNIRLLDQRMVAFRESSALLKDIAGTRSISYDSEWKGFRPPSPYTPFFAGLEPLLPNKVTLSRDGFTLTNEQWTADPQSVLFGQFDVFFLVSVLLSLSAFVFAHAAIAAERESGELKYTLTAPISRHGLLTGKILGNYFALSLSFLSGFVIALPLMWLSPALTSNLPETLTYVALFASISLLFILGQMMIAFLLLLLFRIRGAAWHLLLLVWLLLTIVIPKSTPIVSGLIQPARSREIADLLRRQIRDRSDYEFKHEAMGIFDSTMRAHELDPNRVHSPVSPDVTPAEKSALTDYWRQTSVIDTQMRRKLDLDLDSLNEAETSLSHRRRTTSLMLSRLLPFGCFSNVVAAISANGPRELDVLLKNAEEFQADGVTKVYSRFSIQYYGLAGTVITADSSFVPERAGVLIPVLAYKHPELAKSLVESWPDLLLLLIVPIACAVSSFNRFSRFDVR